MNTVTFHLHLLSQVIDSEQYPLTKMMIDSEMTEAEYKALFQLLETLNEKYKRQKAEGLLDYTSLLVHFAGMLDPKLSPNETIHALKKEGYYPEMMTEFLKLIEQLDMTPL